MKFSLLTLSMFLILQYLSNLCSICYHLYSLTNLHINEHHFENLVFRFLTSQNVQNHRKLEIIYLYNCQGPQTIIQRENKTICHVTICHTTFCMQLRTSCIGCLVYSYWNAKRSTTNWNFAKWLMKTLKINTIRCKKLTIIVLV